MPGKLHGERAGATLTQALVAAGIAQIARAAPGGRKVMLVE
jgi:hypothetical protein